MLAFKENQLNPSPFPRTYCKTTNAFSCLWSMTRMKAVNEIHSLMNDIYDIPDLGYSQWNVRQRLKAACLLLLNFWLQISTLIYTQLQPPWTILLEVFFLGYGYLLLSVFPLVLRASTGNFSQSFFESFSGGGSMPLTTPTYKQAFLGQGSLASKRSSWLKTANSSKNGPPTRGEEWHVCPFVLTRWEIVQPVLSKAVLQPAKAATMRTAPRTEINPPTFPYPTFFQAQNLSSKWIAPTDNMWPKADEGVISG